MSSLNKPSGKGDVSPLPGSAETFEASPGHNQGIHSNSLVQNTATHAYFLKFLKVELLMELPQ